MVRGPHRAIGCASDATTRLDHILRPWQTCREAGTQSQGSAPARQTPGRRRGRWPQFEVLTAVKANLARFTYALMVLGTLVLSLGAGKRW